MKEGSAPKPQKSKRLASPKLIMADELGDLFERVQDSIARRAYELYERRGCEDGRELDDWLAAEAELLRPISEEITQSDQKILLRAPMPGFTAQETEVGISPDRVIICAKKASKSLKTADGLGQNLVQDSAILLETIPLPATIDPAHAVARFTNETLTLELPKAV